jgi:hypothetical protein
MKYGLPSCVELLAPQARFYVADLSNKYLAPGRIFFERSSGLQIAECLAEALESDEDQANRLCKLRLLGRRQFCRAVKW